ncbi:MAG TPA: FAD-binding oxidoreductase [Candidatus Didemnitutus sp.]|nr:FAD-binding oxidoreductase [Candidatus Didemnitutus sp.]
MKHAHIVGCGLAGTLLAWELKKLGVEVTVVDTMNPESSSRVAAGMITPITGRRLKPTWRGHELTQIARTTYAGIEQEFGISLWSDWTLKRVFREEIMREWFHDRRDKHEYDPIIVTDIEPGVRDGVAYPFGGFEHGSVATVDIPTLLSTVGQSLAQQNDVGGTVHVPDVTITCTGYQTLQDPLWSWLPIEPSKGEILDVRIPGLHLDHILTNGTWILPVGGDHYRIGATHDWDDHEPSPTEAGRIKLLADAQQLVGREIVVLGQRAAIRPSTKFKRPFVGRHPTNPTQAVFTGLGTKGALQGPWAAQQLARHLVYEEPLDQDIDIIKWWKS